MAFKLIKPCLRVMHSRVLPKNEMSTSELVHMLSTLRHCVEFTAQPVSICDLATQTNVCHLEFD